MNFTEQIAPVELDLRHQKLKNKEIRVAGVEQSLFQNASYKRRKKMITQRTTYVVSLKRDTECY